MWLSWIIYMMVTIIRPLASPLNGDDGTSICVRCADVNKSEWPDCPILHTVPTLTDLTHTSEFM